MELDEIDTPRDWPKHVREFLTLEQMLRCEICFKFFTNCMMTSCSHNFCSLCIRKHLSYKSSCPICFKEVIEPALRSNRLIDEVVIAFYNARSKLIEMLHGSIVGEEVKRPFERQTLANKPVDGNDYFCDAVQPTLETSLTREKSQAVSKTKYIGLLNKLPLPKRPYLSKKVYTLMKDKQIKDCLRQAGLNMKGKREELVRRYKHYVILYNAECDSENPRPVSDLVKEIEEEEKSRQTLNYKSQKCFSTNHRSDPDDIEKERKQYVQSHSSEYQKLIAEIKLRKCEGESDVSILSIPSTSALGEQKICITISSDSSDSETTASGYNPHTPRSGRSSNNEEITGPPDLDETLLLNHYDFGLHSTPVSRQTIENDSDATLPIGEIAPLKSVLNDQAAQNERFESGYQRNATEVHSLQSVTLQNQPGQHRKRKTIGPTITPSTLNLNTKSSARRMSLRKRNSPPLTSTKNSRYTKQI